MHKEFSKPEFTRCDWLITSLSLYNKRDWIGQYGWCFDIEFRLRRFMCFGFKFVPPTIKGPCISCGTELTIEFFGFYISVYNLEK
jgi:hypothetical protein